MSDIDSSKWQRWAVIAHRPRKDFPRVYEDVDDATLADLLKRTNQTLAIVTRPEQKTFDAQPEARRIRAMSEEARNELRKESLAIATRVRDEFRRRMS